MSNTYKKPTIINPNDPALWQDYDPEQDVRSDEYVDGKSDDAVRRAAMLYKALQTTKWRDNHAAGVQRRQQDPEYIEANKRGNKKMAETQRKRYEDPAERQKLSDVAKQAWQRPGYRENAIQKLYERFADVNDHPRYKGPIIGMHTDTGHYIVIRGSRDYKQYGIRRGTVEDAIKANKPAVNFYWSRVTEDYVAEYADTGAKQITDIEPYVREHTIVATHTETGEVLEFARMRDVVEAGYHRGHVWKRMNTGSPYRGYVWTTKPYRFDQ